MHYNEAINKDDLKNWIASYENSSSFVKGETKSCLISLKDLEIFLSAVKLHNQKVDFVQQRAEDISGNTDNNMPQIVFNDFPTTKIDGIRIYLIRPGKEYFPKLFENENKEVQMAFAIVPTCNFHFKSEAYKDAAVCKGCADTYWNGTETFGFIPRKESENSGLCPPSCNDKDI
jgi:hypothetical protein